MLTKHRTILFVLLAVAAVAIFAFEPSLAWASGDPFAKADSKGKELHEWITGNIAITITAVVIAVVGILMLMNRISHLIGIRIIIATLIIGSSMAIAKWAYQ